MEKNMTLSPGEKCQHPLLFDVEIANLSGQPIAVSDFSENGFAVSVAPPTRLESSKKLTGSNIAGLRAGTPYKKLLRDDQGQVVGICNAITPAIMLPKRKSAQRDASHRLGRRLR
jgi:hypothetical protein